jgi:predicted extracellular nuclease
VLDESCTVTIENTAVTDGDANDPPDQMAADHVFSFQTATAPLAIHDVQGAAHRSPRLGEIVTLLPAVVTAVAGNGFYLQAFDDDVDADPATSEAILIFTGSSAPAVSVGDEVIVSGRVAEFRPGGNTGNNLSTTEISSPTVTPVDEDKDLPDATVIGIGGRTPPTTVIEDDASGSVETSGVFDPAQDGIDFYESLEAMRVQVNDAVAVGPTNDFGEIAVLADNGAGASLRTPRGGIVIRPGDFNPERIILDDVLAATPDVDVGDTFPAPVRGVMDYGFGNFKLLVTSTPSTSDGGLTREVTDVVAGEGELTTAAFNVENLDPGDGPTFAVLAGLIVENLRSPDIIALEEVQDDNGAVNDATTDASLTAAALISAIEAAGGPTYEYRDIDPVDDRDGGEPGGNIRVAFLFRTDRGLSFVDRPGGTPISATTVVSGPDGPQLSASPGRIQPNSPAFNSSRKPLAGEFSFNGQTIFVIANHFNSKGGDDPLFGRFQPPMLSSEVQRLQQAAIVNDFVEDILAADADANIVVLGDLNDFQFAAPLQTVAGDDLTILIETLPAAERYTYVFDGNSQALDHILTSDGIDAARTGFDVVHINAEFSDQASDHDPSIARFLVGVPTDKDDCKQGGWQDFTNPTFPNQGQCVSWVNHH